MSQQQDDPAPILVEIWETDSRGQPTWKVRSFTLMHDEGVHPDLGPTGTQTMLIRERERAT